MKVKTEDLTAFTTVADTGSFSAAARELDIQVARISRSVARLEKAVNSTLFNRSTRRVELTEEGQVYLRYVKDGLNMLAKGEEQLSLLKGQPAGRLRVDAASPFVIHQLAPHINAFTKAYPQITLDLTSHENIIDLLEYKADLAIRIGDLEDSNLHARRLGTSSLHLVASPDYLQNAGALNTSDDLKAHRLIGFTQSPALNDWPLKKPVPLSFAIWASSGETVRQLCLSGQGIALLSNFMCRDDINQHRLTEVLPAQIASPNRRESVNAVFYKNSAVSSRITAFLDFIQPRLTL